MVSSPIGQYCYRPLRRDEIRIAYLQPGIGDREISCRLEHVNLNRLPAYQALSYVWGDSEFTEGIMLDDSSHQVTANLYAALRHLRQSDKSLAIWIDAICINQNDIEERNKEVLKMRYIYQSASQVTIWLGVYAPSSEEEVQHALEYAREIAGLGSSEANMVENFDEQGLETLRMLNWRDWFRRIWVIQEVLVCQQGTSSLVAPHAVFKCGDHEIPFDTFLLCTYRLREIKDDPRMKKSLATGLSYYNAPIIDLWQSWCIHHDLDPAFQFKKLTLAEQLLHLLSLAAGGRMCTLPQDRFYALLGLVQGQLPESLHPDYQLNAADVFHTYAKYLIKNLQIPWVLEYSTFVDDSGPSWVPDWATSPSRNPPDLRGPIKLSADGLTIEVEGTHLGEVADVIDGLGGAFSSPESQDSSIYIADLRKYLLSCEDSMRRQFVQTTPGSWDETLRTWLKWVLVGFYFPQKYYELYEVMLGRRAWKQEYGSMENLSSLIQTFMYRFTEKSFFVMKGGGFGSLYISTESKRRLRTGDKLVFLRGCINVLALRRVDDGYRVIGSCFLSQYPTEYLHEEIWKDRTGEPLVIH